MAPLVLSLWHLAAAGFAPSAHGQQPSRCARPEFKLLRYEEDYSFLRDPSCRTDLWDPIKFVDLGGQGSIYLSFGLDVRERYEYLRNYDWGRGPQDTGGYLLQRYMLYTDLHIDRIGRLFLQLKSGLVTWRNGGPRPSDEDQFDIHQAFVESFSPLGDAGFVQMRVGRQELAFGASRLVAVREGPNIRRTFDGARLSLGIGQWQTDAFFVAPVETDPGILDDGQQNQWFGGVHFTGPLFQSGAHLDLYYFGLIRQDAIFNQGVAREVRHSVGTRLSGVLAGLDYDVESTYQLGSFGSGPIRAWSAASETGYTIAPIVIRPRIGLKANITSGDKSPDESGLQTFNPLFPRGNYFGEAGLLGPLNIMDLHPLLEFHIADRLTILFDWDFFWRQSTADGLYRNSTLPQVSGTDTRARYIGSQPSVRLEWKIERHLTMVANYLHFFTGPFMQESGVGRDVDFVALWLYYKI